MKHLIYILISVLAFVLSVLSVKAQEVRDSVNIPEEQKLYEKALKYIDSLQYDKAEPLLLESIKKNKKYVPSLMKLGYIKLQQKDFKSSEKYFKTALKYDVSQWEALKYLGKIYYETKKYKESKMMLDSAYHYEAQDPTSFYSLYTF
jgi:Tfp pilus assembly protein PilF